MDKRLEKYHKLENFISKNNNILLIKDEIKQKELSRKYLCNCSFCGREYYSGSPSGNYCGHCNIEVLCLNCNEKLNLNYRYINFEEDEMIQNYCTRCLRIQSNKRLKESGNCLKCGKFSKKRYSKGYCEDCSYNLHKNRINNIKSKGCCVNCNKLVENRDSFSRCKECHDLWYLKHNNSEKMKQIQIKQGKKSLNRIKKQAIVLYVVNIINI